MRWYERTALVWLGVLILGAVLLGTEWVATRLFDSGIDRAFHDTYYIVAHRHYMLSLAAILFGGAAVFGGILWLGTTIVRGTGAIAISLWGLAIAAAALPQHIVPRAGMPRRHIDEPEVMLWSTISKTAEFVAMILALVMIVLLVVALIQRLRRRAGT